MRESEAMAEGRITTEARGHLLLIGIDRPRKLNGFTPKMLRELSDAYIALEHGEAHRCGVLHAAGEHFTAGLDLPKVAPLIRRGESIWSDGAIDPLNLRAPRRSKPVVVAVKGITYTIGIELMLAADVVVAAEDCRFAQLEVKRAIMAAGGATIRMAQSAGWGNAMRYLLTGDEFDAATALRLGFVQEIVPAGRELPRAIEIAERIAGQAPLAVQASLLNARLAAEAGFEAAVAEFRAVNKRLAATEDAREGVQSFIEKRPPRFAGK